MISRASVLGIAGVPPMNPALPLAIAGRGADRLAADMPRVVVVGASGWMGRASLEMLRNLFGPAFADRVVSFGSSPRPVTLRDGTIVEQRDLRDIGDLNAEPTLAFNLAFLTLDWMRRMSREAYEETNRAISGLVLANLDRIGATGVFLPSSGAAYEAETGPRATARQVYGALKVEQEDAFQAWASRGRDRRLAVARVFNISGPYINKLGDYALSAFIMDALRGEPVMIRAARPVRRSYISVGDLLSLAFGLVTDPLVGVERFDTASDLIVEVGDVARAVLEVTGSTAGMIRPALRDATPDNYVGDGACFRQLCGTQDVRLAPFPAQVGQTAHFLAHQLEAA